MNSDAGKKALAELRNENKALGDRLKALEPLAKLAEVMGVKPEPGKTTVETLTAQMAQMQSDLDNERLGRIRAEVARDKKLPAAFASVLRGKTVDEMAAHADELLAAAPGIAAPAANGGTPGTPQPDPTQGSRGGTTEIEAALKAAQDKGDTREVVRLKTALAAQRSRK
jgi:hypothetical protein